MKLYDLVSDLDFVFCLMLNYI